MQEYWVETVDEELTLLGQLVGAAPHVLGLDIDTDRHHVDVVVAADSPEDVLDHVQTRREQVKSERLTVGIRRSRHTLDDLHAGLRHVDTGDWARRGGAIPEGPMSFGYGPRTDRIEVTMTSAAAGAAERLTSDLPELVHVVLDDSMTRGS